MAVRFVIAAHPDFFPTAPQLNDAFRCARREADISIPGRLVTNAAIYEQEPLPEDSPYEQLARKFESGPPSEEERAKFFGDIWRGVGGDKEH